MFHVYGTLLLFTGFLGVLWKTLSDGQKQNENVHLPILSLPITNPFSSSPAYIYLINFFSLPFSLALPLRPPLHDNGHVGYPAGYTG